MEDEDLNPIVVPLQDEVCEIWPCNRLAFELLTACVRHFKLTLGGMGGAHWGAVSSGDVAREMDWLGVSRRDQRELRRQYLSMEDEALRILNEREAEAARKAASG